MKNWLAWSFSCHYCFLSGNFMTLVARVKIWWQSRQCKNEKDEFVWWKYWLSLFEYKASWVFVSMTLKGKRICHVQERTSELGLAVVLLYTTENLIYVVF